MTAAELLGKITEDCGRDCGMDVDAAAAMIEVEFKRTFMEGRNAERLDVLSEIYRAAEYADRQLFCTSDFAAREALRAMHTVLITCHERLSSGAHVKSKGSVP